MPAPGPREWSAPQPLDVETRFRPSAYTACLLRSSLERLERNGSQSGFEVGVGGGYVMAALLQAGARQFLGVDILADAVDEARSNLERLGLGDRGRVEVGNVWNTCNGKRFDLIVANLPQFPLQSPLNEGHPPTWSDGGPDGRALIDPFIAGLAAHLEPGGAALMTHNVFVDLARTLRAVEADGLLVREATRQLVPLSTERVVKLRDGHRTWGLRRELEAEDGLLFVGPQAFAEFAVLEIIKPPAASS